MSSGYALKNTDFHGLEANTLKRMSGILVCDERRWYQTIRTIRPSVVHVGHCLPFIFDGDAFGRQSP